MSSRRIWRSSIGGNNSATKSFDAIFHLASITDTTVHDQFVQVHDNVESFRRLLKFARPNKTRIVYASSAATYGAASGMSREADEAAPANVYAFSKAMMDNIARRAARRSEIGSSSGCATSTFTGRAKRTKACRRA